MKRLVNLVGSALLALAAFLAPTSALADAANGKALYTTNCLACHGETGKGDGPVGAALNPTPRDFSVGEFKFDANKDGTAGTDEDLQLVIVQGAGAFGGSPLMAPWAHLPESDIQDIILYIRALKQ